jgi:GAF domain-containing protein
VALENARRLAQEGGALELTNPFYRMARQVAAARNVDDVWTVLLELINEYRPARAFIFETSSEAEDIRLAAQLRIGEITFPERKSQQNELVEKLHLHILLKDLENPLFVDDVQKVESLPPSRRTSLIRLHEDSAARGLAILPVRLGSHIMAEIVVIFHTAHPFKIAEKQFYTALADTAAVVLENIRLLESTQRRVVRERTVRSITDRMRQAPDMKSLLRITAESLVETLGGEGAYVQLGPPERSDVLESPIPTASEEGAE